jgi:hypothetical protein
MAKYLVQMRRGTAEEWTTVGSDIVPLEGELVLEMDKSVNGLHRLKIGDGKSLYSELPYMSVDSFVLPTPISVTLDAQQWTQATDTDNKPITGKYFQTVEVNNATITPNSKVDLQPSSEQLCIFHEKDLSFVAENVGGKVSVYCVGQVPENDYTIQATVTETTPYEGKVIGNTVGTPNPRPDWSQTDEKKADYIKNKPTILTEDEIKGLIVANGGTSGGAVAQVQSDWMQNGTNQVDYIKNKPPIVFYSDAAYDASDESDVSFKMKEIYPHIVKPDSYMCNLSIRPNDYIIYKGALYQTVKITGRSWNANKVYDILPAVTTNDDGKFLRVVDGEWSVASVPSAEGVVFE